MKRKKFKAPFIVHTWTERDRANVWVEDNNGKVVAKYQDEELLSMVEDGFFKNGSRFGESVISYLVDSGVIKAEKMWNGFKYVDVLPDFEVD